MINKTGLALGITVATLTITGALVAPQAVAGSKSDMAAMNSKVEALEAQLQAMQYELQALRAETSRPADSAKVQELDQWMNSVKSEPAIADEKNNMVFFRGGYAHSDDNRGGANSNGADLLVNQAVDKDAWYFGAGFDWSLNDNLFGAMNGTEVLAELMFDYKEFSESSTSLLTGQAVTTNQLTLAASPKVKFLKGQAFRPWLIPVGLELNIISPPSGAVTVLNPGMQFGLGADYKVWNNLFVGADFRYHYSPDNVDGVNTNGLTTGGYVGIGF